MNAYSELAERLVNHLWRASWEAAVLAGLIFMAQKLFRNRLSPAWRHGLWLLVLLRLAMPVSLQSDVSVFNLAKLVPPGITASVNSLALGGKEQAPLQGIQGPASQDLARFDRSKTPGVGRAAAISGGIPPRRTPSLPPSGGKQPLTPVEIVCGIWLTGVGLLSLRLFWCNLRFGAGLARCAPVAGAEVNELLRDCARTLGVRRRVVLIETDLVETPAVAGLWRRRLLLPHGLTGSFTPDELRHIFRHELAHIKRCDLEVSWIAEVLQILYWFNPVLWPAFARLRAERELATDALALAHAHGRERVCYGETVLKLLEGLVHEPRRPGLVGLAEDKARMKERLMAIRDRDTVKPWRWPALVVAVVLAAAGLTEAQPNGAPGVYPGPQVDGTGGSTTRSAALPVAGGVPVPGLESPADAGIATPLDLTAAYTTPVSAFDQMNGFPAFHSVPRGFQTFNNVPLQIEGMICLWGRSNTESLGIVFPQQVTNIPLGLKFESLYVYHAAFYVSEARTPVCQVVFHYENDLTVTNQMLYGDDVLDWLIKDGEDNLRPAGQNSRLAWVNGRFSPGKNRPLRFCLTEIKNPYPWLAVAFMDLYSCKSATAPCIMAMTAGKAGLMK